jgi:hypothetical protein
VIAEKKARRFHIGDSMTIIFENRQTVLFQIQEMIRTEKIITDHGMQHEIDTYNGLLPGENELSATLLIDITDKHLIKPTLDSLIGLNKNSLYLQVGGKEIPASFDESQIEDDRISAVQYIKWRLAPNDIAAIQSGPMAVELRVRHQNYTASHILSADERSAIYRDLTETADNSLS